MLLDSSLNRLGYLLIRCSHVLIRIDYMLICCNHLLVSFGYLFHSINLSLIIWAILSLILLDCRLISYHLTSYQILGCICVHDNILLTSSRRSS